MRLARFDAGGTTHEGSLEEAGGVLSADGRRFPLDDVRLLAPCRPTKIVCVGRNYAEHAAELGNEVPEQPLIFLKPPSAVLASGATIEYPSWSRLLHFEGELAVVIGKRCKNVPGARANEVILGYTALNDVTARDVQRSDGQWTRGKAFDTSAPLGPWIETDLDLLDTSVRTFVNGELRQDGSTRDLVFSVSYLVAYVSRVMTLEPGDVIATGTPSGVGELRLGDTVEVEIGGLGGRLSNTVGRPAGVPVIA